MATTYTFTVDDFSLTTTWVRYLTTSDGYTYTEATKSLRSAEVTKSFAISGVELGEGEYVKRVTITAEFSRVGTTDYSETIRVNGKNFSKKSRNLDASTLVNNSNYDVTFSFCASGNTGNVLAGQESGTSHSCTLRLSDVTLTVVVGTGGAFEGPISSLPEGSKLQIDEPDGSTGLYTIVQHDYNEGKCLLWRDTVLSNTAAFNYGSDTFVGGALDTYLNTTFYEALPDSTKNYIVAANYPTRTKRLYGSIEDLERYVCTVSISELIDGGLSQAFDEGSVIDYLETVATTKDYWTRSVCSVESRAYRINTSGSYYYYNRDYSSNIRPCFTVLESQLVVLSGDYYIFCDKCTAPDEVLLDDSAQDYVDRQLGFTAVLSWGAGVAGNNVGGIRGYAVWRCETEDGEYEFLGEVTAADDGTIPTSMIVLGPDRGSRTYYYKVQTLGPVDLEYCDSDLSDTSRSISTKNTKIYDLHNNVLAVPKFWNGSSWVDAKVSYYNGNEWIPINT